MAGEDAFRCAVEAHRAVTDEHEYEAVWSLLEPLATATPAVAVQIALAGLGSADAAERSVATDLLGLVAGLHRSHRAQVVRSLLRHSKIERHEDVQWSLAMASAHSDDARTFPVLARLTQSSDADVRYQVAQAVGAVADATTRDTAVRLLRLLAADAEEGVRAKAMETLLTLNRHPEQDASAWRVSLPDGDTARELDWPPEIYRHIQIGPITSWAATSLRVFGPVST